MMVASTQSKLVMINILATHAPLNLLQLLLKSAGSIAEALEDAAYKAKAAKDWATSYQIRDELAAYGF